jgi:hypothetical protein
MAINHEIPIRQMAESLIRLREAFMDVGLQPRTTSLYDVAAQLAIAECSMVHVAPSVVKREYVQRAFADHFEFLCEHTINALEIGTGRNIDKYEQKSKTSGQD